jgi:23S rRNA (guanosine2251-2'-O)-methyltransferase
LKTLPPRREQKAQSAGGRPTHRLLYGVNPVTEALNAGRAVVEAYLLPGKHGPELSLVESKLKAKGVKIQHADRHQLAQMVDSRNHQGVVARVEALPNGSLTGLVKDRPEEPLTVLILDHLQDPQNLGSIYRCADAFGVNLLFIPAHESVSHQLASVAKASSGAVEHVPTVVVRDLSKAIAELKQQGFTLVGLASPDATDKVPSAMLSGAVTGRRVAIALGAEGAGLSRAVRALCDAFATIPTTGKVGSLNAGTACGIALHERFTRLRTTAPSL